MPTRYEGDVTVAIKVFVALAALAGIAAAQYASLRRSPEVEASPGPQHSPQAHRPSASDGIRTLNLRVEQYSAGSCATVSLEGVAKPMVDSCHGWSIDDCDGTLVIRSRGIKLDNAIVLRPSAGNNQLEVVHLQNSLNEALKRNIGDSYEYLDLGFFEPRCSPTGATMDFRGSAIKIGATGSASAVKGVIHLTDNGTNSIVFK